jgi:hypothetical protein
MLRIIAVVLALLLSAISAPAMAQNRVTSVTVGSGEDAIASGITGVVTLTNKDSTLYGEFAVQSQQAWVVWGRALHGKVNGFIAGSVGHFQGALWYGPYVSLSKPIAHIGGKDLTVGTYHWPAFFPTGEPSDWKNDGTKNRESISVGYLANVSLGWGPIELSESRLNFLDDKTNWLPGASVRTTIAQHITGIFNFTWNTNKERPMYYIGASWKVPR